MTVIQILCNGSNTYTWHAYGCHAIDTLTKPVGNSQNILIAQFNVNWFLLWLLVHYNKEFFVTSRIYLYILMLFLIY